MSNFWPGIDLKDTKSPLEILNDAKEDWEKNSNGAMTLVLQQATTTNGNNMIMVHARHLPSARTGAILKVVHRPTSAYPVTIYPEDDEIPDFLKKSYSTAGFDVIASMMPQSIGKVPPRTVTNQWVAETPAEFRAKLKSAFGLGTAKSIILNLAAVAEQTDITDGIESSGSDQTSESG